MKTLGILGAGGHSKVVSEVAIERGWERIFYWDDDFPLRTSHLGKDILGSLSMVESSHGTVDSFFVAIGDNHTRERIVLSLNRSAKLISLRSGSSVVSNSSMVGLGSFIGPRVVVNSFAAIGKATILNTGSIIEHDCSIGNFSHIGPGSTICGSVKVGNRTLIGAGCVVRPEIEIGDDVLIGAGSVVVSNIPAGSKVYGVPGRVRGLK
ncbi:NeuD/PglB/VioB family sugar acetyltransferase [Roseobacter sp. HKCCD5988]|uniref:NeuD/PglB/VioB family sugar acetyltransferase n=1 Tax=Roseobacter sp. HKCCD5988 TaxID=3120338 RepID=UPI0030EF742D